MALNRTVSLFTSTVLSSGRGLKALCLATALGAVSAQAQETETADPIAESPASESAVEDVTSGADEPDMDRILVTATKRAQDVRDVPFAVQAIGEEEIRDIGAADFSELVDEIAGVEFRTTQAGTGAASIRGIAELNTPNIFAGTGTAVGLYLDEIPLSQAGFFPQIAFVDLARVEVLKGPQGTLFGEGSLAGTIRLIANQPNAEEFEASLDATIATITDGGEVYEGNAVINVPLIEDKLALRVVGFYQDNGGFIDRIDPVVSDPFGGPGGTTAFAVEGIEEDANNFDNYGGRFSLKWTPTDNFSATASALITRADRGVRNRATLDRVGTFSGREGTEDDFDAYNLTMERSFSFGTFTSSTSYFDREVSFIADQVGIVTLGNQVSLGVLPQLGLPPQVTESIVTDQAVSSEDFSQEVRFVSDFEGPFQITLGVFYRDRDFDLDFLTRTIPPIGTEGYQGLIDFASTLIGQPPLLTLQPGEGELDLETLSSTRQIAGFGEATYDVNDRLTLLFGARIFNEKRESTTSYIGAFPFFASVTGGTGNIVLPADQFTTEASETIFNPRASMLYDFSEEVTGYFTYSRGFRSGGNNDLFLFTPEAQIPEYDSERLTTYELGVKTDLFGGMVRFNAAGFLNQWSDLQEIVAEGPGGAGETLDNIGDARTYGVDLELAAEPIDGLDIRMSATLLESDITQDIVLPSASTVPFLVSEGTDIPQVAETQFNVSATYRRPLFADVGGLARVSFTHTSESLSSLTSLQDPNQDAFTPGFQTLDFRVGLETEHWAVNFFVDNALDDDITLIAASFPDFVNTNDQLFFQGQPRTIGVNLRLTY